MLRPDSITAADLIATERWCSTGAHWVSALRFYSAVTYEPGTRDTGCIDCRRTANRERYRTKMQTTGRKRKAA